MTPRLGTLELGRFIAALAVMLSHWLGVLGEHAGPGVTVPGTPGPLGVEYFFVLSGFVMMTAHHQDAGSFAAALRFWARRAGRIYPLYWVILLLAMAMIASPWPGARGALAWVTLEPRLVQEIIAPAWSLRYEIAFYLMFGLCLFPVIGRAIALGWVFLVLLLLVPPALWPHALAPAWLAWDLWLGRWNHFISLFEVYFFAGGLAG